MKERSKKILISIVLVLGIALVGFGAYKFIYYSNRAIFSRVISKFEKSLVDVSSNSFEGIIPKSFNVTSDKIKMTTNTTIDTVGIGADISVAFNGDIYMDTTKNGAYIDIDASFQNEFLTNAKLLFKDTKLYFKLEEISPLFYYTDSDINFTVEKEEKSTSYTVIVTYLKEAILENLKDEDFKDSEETLSFSGKDFKTKKISLSITEKKLMEIVITFLEKVKADKNVLELVGNLGLSIEEEKIINEYIKQLKDAIKDASAEILFEYNIYVYGKDNAIKQEVIIPGENEESTIIITINHYENSKGFKNFELKFGTKDQTIVKATTTGTSQTKSNILLDFMGMITVRGTYEITDKKAELEASIEIVGEEYGTIKYLLNTKDSKTFEVNFEAYVEVEDMKVGIVTRNEITIDVPMEEVDTTNSIPVEDMTEEVQKKLQDILDKFEGLSDTEDSYLIDDNYY